MNILIAGGGIAGFNCALRLLRAGHQVTLAEKQRGTIDKVCGEGILPFGVNLLREVGLREEVARAGFPFHELAYQLNNQRISAGFPDGQFGIGIERSRLDQIFRSACLQHEDFRLWEGKKVGPEDGRRFDRVIAADGIHSQWGKGQGRSVLPSKRLGLRFRLQQPPVPRVQVHFFRGCEIYLTPTDENTQSVAFLVDPEKLAIRGGELSEWAKCFFRKNFPAYAHLPLQGLATRGPIASRPKGAEPCVHLIGDAFRAFDPISGAGMSFALLCGKLAVENLDDPRAYAQALRPALRSINEFTNMVLFFRGGGLKTRLMMRQLGKSPATFSRLLSLHNGEARFTDLGLRDLLAVLAV